MKIGLFVDVNNLHYSIKNKFSGRLDYEKFYEQVRGMGELFRVIAYGSQIEAEADDFIRRLKTIGYDTKYKQRRKKANDKVQYVDWNAGIAVDVFQVVDKIDTVVLASSNPNLTPLVEWLKSRGTKVVVFSCGISKELKDTASTFMEIQINLITHAPSTEPEA